MIALLCFRMVNSLFNVSMGLRAIANVADVTPSLLVHHVSAQYMGYMKEEINLLQRLAGL
jgi:hypothetical protein